MAGRKVKLLWEMKESRTTDRKETLTDRREGTVNLESAKSGALGRISQPAGHDLQ